jgi:hypothetical protein
VRNREDGVFLIGKNWGNTMNYMSKMLVLFALALVVSLAVAPVYAVDNKGLFELDWDGSDEADAEDNGNGGDGDDWENIWDGSDSSIATTGIIDDTPPSGNDDNVLTGGGTKDDIDFPSWKWKTAKPTPDKNNITNAFTAAYKDTNGDLIMYFGADRFANNGDAQMGFWFLQGNVAPLGATSGGFSGNHQDGDILVLANFLNGGVVGDVDVWKWCGGCGTDGNNNLEFMGAFSECTGSGANVCALNNSGDIPTGGWAYTPKFGAPGMIPDNSLFEGGINISAVIGPVCLTTFLVETRSSQSTDAVLKDFTMEQIEVCGFDVSKQCSAALAASGGGLDIDFYGTVDNTGAGEMFMTLSDDMGDISVVCFDDALPADECTGADSVPADLDITSGVATFTLAADEVVRYEGSYTVASGDVVINPITGEAEATDTVTVAGRANEGDPDPIDTKTAQATCGIPVDGAIKIDKDCTAGINTAGDTLEVSVTGSGSNTGDITLTDVTLSDPDITNLVIKDKNDAVVTNGAFDLAPGDTYSFTASATESVLTHSNTIMVEGDNAFTGATTSDFDDASCDVKATPAISVSKDCTVGLDFSNSLNTIQIEVGFGGQICNESPVLKLTGLTATDSEAGTLTLSKDWLAPDECITYSGTYLPSTTDGGDDPDPGDASFSDTVTVSATGALGTGSVGDFNDATCDLCPKCPDCPTP